MNRDMTEMRRDYNVDTLLENNLHADPITQFDLWFADAKSSANLEPNAMTLSTIDNEGHPSSRTVLLKEIKNGEFVFYTNYESDKATELSVNPQCALQFVWLELERQVRIKGIARKLDTNESYLYFKTRPRASQIGAWTSPQSQIIKNRKELEDLYEAMTEKFKDNDAIPLPPNWGGYRVKPLSIEFWQGRSSRLHDRISYEQSGEGWIFHRLAP